MKYVHSKMNARIMAICLDLLLVVSLSLFSDSNVLKASEKGMDEIIIENTELTSVYEPTLEISCDLQEEEPVIEVSEISLDNITEVETYDQDVDEALAEVMDLLPLDENIPEDTTKSAVIEEQEFRSYEITSVDLQDEEVPLADFSSRSNESEQNSLIYLYVLTMVAAVSVLIAYKIKKKKYIESIRNVRSMIAFSKTNGYY